ncbi:MAG: hypothetical protein ACO23C_08465 [Prochlorococcaceae cyanobacterium]
MTMTRAAAAHHPPSRRTPAKAGRQVSLWADLLDDLDHGEPSISTTASEMAQDVPSGLRGAVNSELARRGCRFRIET